MQGHTLTSSLLRSLEYQIQELVQKLIDGQGLPLIKPPALRRMAGYEKTRVMVLRRLETQVGVRRAGGMKMASHPQILPVVGGREGGGREGGRGEEGGGRRRGEGGGGGRREGDPGGSEESRGDEDGLTPSDTASGRWEGEGGGRGGGREVEWLNYYKLRRRYVGKCKLVEMAGDKSSLPLPPPSSLSLLRVSLDPSTEVFSTSSNTSSSQLRTSYTRSQKPPSFPSSFSSESPSASTSCPREGSSRPPPNRGSPKQPNTIPLPSPSCPPSP